MQQKHEECVQKHTRRAHYSPGVGKAWDQPFTPRRFRYMKANETQLYAQPICKTPKTNLTCRRGEPNDCADSTE